MIDAAEFHRRLGAATPLGQDDHLMLEPGVRVVCDASGWTAIFESLPADDEQMTALFEGCAREPSVLPFTTRSSQLALRWWAEPQCDDTEAALRTLQACLGLMHPDRAPR